MYISIWKSHLYNTCIIIIIVVTWILHYFSIRPHAEVECYNDNLPEQRTTAWAWSKHVSQVGHIITTRRRPFFALTSYYFLCCVLCKKSGGAVVDLQLQMQSSPITTKVVISNPVHGEVYSIQHCVIKCVSDLR